MRVDRRSEITESEHFMIGRSALADPWLPLLRGLALDSAQYARRASLGHELV